MNKHWKQLAIVGVAALISLAGATAVLADRGTGFFGRGEAGAGQETALDRGNMGGFAGKMQGMRDRMRPGKGGMANEAIAEALGLTQEELQAELEAGKTLAEVAEEQGVELQDLRDAAEADREQARRDAIAQAVKDGDMTQEQADWIIEGMDNGYGGPAGPKGGFAERGNTRQGSQEVIAAMLGMTTDELSTQLWGGNTLANLAEDAGVELADIQEAVQAARQASQIEAIEQAVEDGTMDEAEAEWLIEGIENDYGPAGRAPIGGPGGPRGRH